ncbi:unnamed protein product [Lactuca virosa]|uniref:F-box domain-containing protein n=1 Tax=Lactuca virosa TaxID=75947 RepID=A0AAU9NDH0_9ASTR|nr:unnamed protein product [Lactuca virosa]
MSEYVAFEIQAEIIKRLPVKSLLQFRSVSKPWKSLIDSSEFISGYRVHQTDRQRLLVWYKDPVDTNEKYVTFVDDEAFAQQEVAPAVPVLSKFLNDLKMVGSSQGLLCFYGYYQDPSHPRFEFATEMAVLWNPSIRKSICVTVPGESRWSKFVLGFGVCPITNDPTIVKITNVDTYFTTDDSSPMVEVFTLSKECDSIKILGFTKKDEAIMETQDDYGEPATVVVYEPSSKRFNDTGINGKHGALFVSLYMETLLLLDQLDFSVV